MPVVKGQEQEEMKLVPMVMELVLVVKKGWE